MIEPQHTGEQDLLPGYAEWIERVSSTYRSVAYCCAYRLGDQALAQRISAEVVAEMLARPKVFRYSGLPFSGQIARLTEPRIAQASQEKQRGEAIEPGKEWQEILRQLLEISREQQEVFVLAYVEGFPDAELGAALGCEEDAARRQRESVSGLLRDLSAL